MIGSVYNIPVLQYAMLRYLPLIVKNCWRNRRRTVLTVASIAISMCLLGVMVAMFDAFCLSKPAGSEAATALKLVGLGDRLPHVFNGAELTDNVH